MLETLTTVTVPLLGFILPGIAYPTFAHRHTTISAIARVILWSTSWSILSALAYAMAGLPVILSPLSLMIITSLILWFKRSTLTRVAMQKTLASLIVALSIIAVFSVPAFMRLYGLPSGDMQKTILWASVIVQTNQLPQYTSAITTLNRDPVDFYTPGLHAWAASILSFAGYPLIAMSLWAIALAVATTFIAIALARLILPQENLWLLSFFTGWLILTNYRFLRYLNLPGYHIQNLAGELLLFGVIFISLSLLKKYRAADMVLLVLLLASLSITHQFSTFIAAFVLIPIIIIAVYRYLHQPKTVLHLVPIILILIGGIGLAIYLNLDAKIPHIFSFNPHLSNYAPNLLDYFTLMGSVWFTLGISGLVLMLLNTYHAKKSPTKKLTLAFISSSVIILALSQAPHFYIDIPPIRALFYLAIPFSISGAYLISNLWQRAHHQLLAHFILIVIVIFACLGSVTRAYQAPINTPNNSTLTPGLLDLSQTFQNVPAGAILVDDYNQRAASWLVLSGHPMYTRLASNISRLTDEAFQSKQRRSLYLHQLDYEKIFSLASLPAITQLMRDNNITYLATTNQAASGFAANPSLRPAAQTDQTTIFTTNQTNQYQSPITDPITQWLLRSSTLVNDIGDSEDTYKHLPASLGATNLSDPRIENNITTRQTNAAFIPLLFNVKDYIHPLWDIDNTNFLDTDMQLYVQLPPNSPNLTVRLPDGSEQALPPSGILRLPNHALPIQDGFITVFLLNPTKQLVTLDLIALGLTSTQ